MLEDLNRLSDACSLLSWWKIEFSQHKEISKIRLTNKLLNELLLRVAFRIENIINHEELILASDHKAFDIIAKSIEMIVSINFQEQENVDKIDDLLKNLKKTKIFIENIFIKDANAINNPAIFPLDQDEIKLIREKILIIISEGCY